MILIFMSGKVRKKHQHTDALKSFNSTGHLIRNLSVFQACRGNPADGKNHPRSNDFLSIESIR